MYYISSKNGHKESLLYTVICKKIEEQFIDVLLKLDAKGAIKDTGNNYFIISYRTIIAVLRIGTYNERHCKINGVRSYPRSIQ